VCAEKISELGELLLEMIFHHPPCNQYTHSSPTGQKARCSLRSN